MKNTTILFPLLLLLWISLTLLINPSDAITDAQIESICSNTTNPHFCLKTLKFDPRTAASDLRSVGRITTNLAYQSAVSLRKFTGSLAGTTPDPELKKRLRNCTSHYSSAASSLAGAKRSFKFGDFGGAAVGVNKAVDAAEQCEDEFDAGPPVVVGLEEKSNEVGDLCSIVIAIADLLT